MATWVSGFSCVVWGCWLLLVGGGGVWLHKEDGWWVDVLREVCENHQCYHTEWMDLVRLCVCGGGGGGGGRCENVWLHKEDRGWVDVLGEVCGNHQWLPHWVSGFGWVCVCGWGDRCGSVFHRKDGRWKLSMAASLSKWSWMLVGEVAREKCGSIWIHKED